MKNSRLFAFVSLIVALTVGAGTSDNGIFRFLTQSLPDGTTNAEYAARFITANADGPVTFSTISALPAGLSLDPLSGFLTGIPTQTFNHTITVIARDGTQQIQFDITLKINAAGGGGNGGASFGNESLSGGRVGTVYSEQLTIANGVGPFTFGAKDLPPGISLNGQTGVLSGNPSAAGRYFVTFSAYDAGEGNNSSTVLPIVVLPSASDFRFVTQSPNNGEIGTPYYDAYLVTNASGTVTFSMSGLPQGLTLDAATGVISGMPTSSGTYEVFISASDGHDTITCNLGMIIVPSATSHLYWNVFNLPPGLLGVAYDRQPPLTVASVNGSSVSYTATGLPPGISYNAFSGELTGTPTEVGEFDTVFTATNGVAEALTLQFRFVILSATGGDLSSVPVNFWLTKEKVTLGEDGSESWKGMLVFNDDRRTGLRFDPATNDLSLSLGSRTLNLPPGSFVGTSASMNAATASGQIPIEAMKLSLSKQTLQWKTGKDTLAATVPGLYNVVLTLGSKAYRTSIHFDVNGNANGLSSVRPAFVLSKGKLKAGAPGFDGATLGLLLSDASFIYQTNDTLRIRLLQGATVLMDRDFTELGIGQQTTNPNGKLIFGVKSLSDPATTNRISKFSYNSGKGALSLSLSGLALGELTNGEAQLTIELTIKDRIYTTSVTFFGTNPGTYSTTMP